MELTPDDRRVFEKFRSMPEADQRELIEFMQDTLTELKADWGSHPENKGRSVTYTELWDEFMRNVSEAEDPTAEQP